MNIKILKVGDLECNCYILEKDNNVILIDPGDDSKLILKEINNKKLICILITHNHFDHIGALNDILNKYNVKVYDKNILEEKEYNISIFKFKVIFNPGHTSDSVSYLFNNKLFCGDFIFKNSIGRCDLPTGNYNQMLNSINKIKKYKDLTIYPGHGDITTLEEEKKYNYYFNLKK